MLAIFGHVLHSGIGVLDRGAPLRSDASCFYNILQIHTTTYIRIHFFANQPYSNTQNMIFPHYNKIYIIFIRGNDAKLPQHHRG